MRIAADRDAVLEHFMRRVSPDVNGGCWIWMGHLNEEDYGVFRMGMRWTDKAHRVGYELFKGAIPAGLQIDHLCRNRWCVNPAHLEAVTQWENMMRGHDGRIFAKTHCKNGHLRDGNMTPSRDCRTCCRAATARYLARKRARLNVATPAP